MATFNRRNFINTFAAGVASVPFLMSQNATAQEMENPKAVIPKKLKAGDTIGLISPAGAVYENEPYDIAIESLQALGFKVKESKYLRARYGHFAGTNEQRIEEINTMFADQSVHGILALRGGSGCNRLVDGIDYELIRKNPKFFAGFSDLTTLINAIYAKTGLVTFHSLMGTSEWNEFSVDSFKKVVMNGEAVTYENPKEKGGLLTQTTDRIRTINKGKAKGVLVGGNLAVLTSLVGTPYLPDFKGTILFLEEINEQIYRVDRMISQLKLAGILNQVAGIVIGKFTGSDPDKGYGTLTLDEVFDDYFKSLKIPVFSGLSFGHIRNKMTIPVGIEAEMDADAGTIRLLKPAVG